MVKWSGRFIWVLRIKSLFVHIHYGLLFYISVFWMKYPWLKRYPNFMLKVQNARQSAIKQVLIVKNSYHSASCGHFETKNVYEIVIVACSATQWKGHQQGPNWLFKWRGKSGFYHAQHALFNLDRKHAGHKRIFH